mgnify:FL=1
MNAALQTQPLCGAHLMPDMSSHLTLVSLLSVIAFLFGAYQLLVVSGVLSISTMELRLTHLMLALTLLFARKPIAARLAGKW